MNRARGCLDPGTDDEHVRHARVGSGLGAVLDRAMHTNATLTTLR